jgi:hypothetical protein
VTEGYDSHDTRLIGCCIWNPSVSMCSQPPVILRELYSASSLSYHPASLDDVDGKNLSRHGTQPAQKEKGTL